MSSDDEQWARKTAGAIEATTTAGAALTGCGCMMWLILAIGTLVVLLIVVIIGMLGGSG